MTRWKPGHKEATRRQILDAASRLFREQGYAPSGVAEVMDAAGLTVGAFYAHFDSKEALLAAVLADAFARTRDGLLAGLDDVAGAAFTREVTRRYLSRAHRDQVAEGCVLPALAAEVGRQGAAPRHEIERYLCKFVALVEHKTTSDDALALAALSVGGILLARAVEDEPLSNAILKACRRFAAPEETA